MKLDTYLLIFAGAIMMLAAILVSVNAASLYVMTHGVTQTLVANEGIIPTGVPAYYGQELGVSYDQISPYNPQMADDTIRKLGNLDRTIQLQGADLERYVRVLYSLHNGISCEYCCGARSIIFPNGQPACGCAHSYAMRGIAKYIITQHGTDFTDEEILAELGKWKTLFFPTQMQNKAAIMESQNIEVNYVTLASNQYRGIEKGATGGGMVGGC